MSVPLPDDTAVDMLSFALSGPGIFTTSVFTVSALAILFSFADIGPRKASPTFYLLRVELSASTVVEMPNGSVQALRAGEAILRLQSYEECMVVVKRLPEERGVRYLIYRAGNGEMRLLSEFPKKINAIGGNWPQGVVQKEDEKEMQARWEEYSMLGEIGDVDKEWYKFLERLGGISIERGAECKLCGGVGYRRCHKCGGASRRGRKLLGGFVCDCEAGRRKCEWCGQR